MKINETVSSNDIFSFAQSHMIDLVDSGTGILLIANNLYTDSISMSSSIIKSQYEYGKMRFIFLG